MHPAVERIGELGIVLAVRAAAVGDNFVQAIRAVVNGGLRAVEISLNTPGALSLIEKVRGEFGDDVLLGAGTVLNPSDALAAAGAGATFLLAPSTNIEVIGLARRLGVAVLPGAFTPTEIVRAWSAGADAVKVFPASLGGPEMIRILRGPLPDVPMLPTGGVVLDNIREYLAAGALAVAVGGALLRKDLVASGDRRGLTETARRFVEEVRRARS